MPHAAEWLVFLGATALFAFVPGPGMLYVLARSLRGGRAEGFQSGIGTALGVTVHVLAAAAGLSAVLVTSAAAFTVIKLVGAVHLIYLGIRALFSKSSDAVEPPRQARRSAVVQGVITEVLNPKTALVVPGVPAALRPPRSRSRAAGLRAARLVVVAMGLVADMTVALFAGPLGSRLAASRRWHVRQRVATGATMIGLVGFVALAERG
ncbi:MAG TPA: LysE family translocator [Pseudonocardiaceae bacterium]|nr:LysE family translocator [Pseudonocardiaceae bacterium]